MRAAPYGAKGDQAKALRTGDRTCDGTASASGACQAADWGKPATQQIRSRGRAKDQGLDWRRDRRAVQKAFRAREETQQKGIQEAEFR